MEVKLTNGGFAIIDESDFDLIKGFNWFKSRDGYALSTIGLIKMHRLILGAKEKELVDHKDRDKLNNTRSNLRIVSICENVHNQQKRLNTKNNYKGTSYNKKLGLWQSRCRINGNNFYLGYYISEIAAAYAYNKKAIELSECILLNKFDLTIEELESKLFSDLRKRLPSEKRSEQKGVYWHKKGVNSKEGSWSVQFRVNGKLKSFGRYSNEQDAINIAQEIISKNNYANL